MESTVFSGERWALWGYVLRAWKGKLLIQGTVTIVCSLAHDIVNFATDAKIKQTILENDICEIQVVLAYFMLKLPMSLLYKV